MYASILEDTLVAERILRECDFKIQKLNIEMNMGQLSTLKYGVEQSPETDKLKGINRRNIHSQQNKLSKLEDDKNLLSSVISATYVDLSCVGNFKPLREFVEHAAGQEIYRKYLKEDEAMNKILCRDLKRQLRLLCVQHRTAIADADAIIERLSTNYEDSSQIAEARKRYVEKWQQSRTEQHSLSIQEKVSNVISGIKHYKNKHFQEQRVHDEVALLSKIIVDETLQKVEDIMSKYEKDMEAIELKVQIKRSEYLKLVERRKHLTAEIEKHKKEINDWMQFKDARTKLQQYNASMNQSASVVQAWWRGILVRQRLGPYKPKKSRR